MTVDGNGVNSWTNISCKQNAGGLNQKYQFEIPPTPQGIKYFKKPLYNGYSIVDGLKSIREESSFEYRTIIAKINGIQKYNKSNNVKENEFLVKLLKEGKLKKPFLFNTFFLSNNLRKNEINLIIYFKIK